MADIRCPNCKQNNPDFLDVCQFCQTPLKPESMVHIGEKPTKKGTGDLENALPEWLRDMRQQARESAEEDASQTAAQPKVQKDEAPDLLAGLVSQTKRAEDEDVPDWLSSINPIAKQKPLAPAESEPETDFFAQFNKSTSEPPAMPVEKPSEKEAPSAPSQPPTERDELSAWFSQAAEQPAEPVSSVPDTSQTEMGWMNNFDSPEIPAQAPASKVEEDLGWLRDLEASSKQTGDLAKPQQDIGWMPNIQAPSSSAQPSSAPDDLSWLNDLGGISEPTQPAASQPSAPKDDLSWLNNLDGTSKPLPATPSQSSAPKDDLSWLNNLGETSEPLPPTTPQSSAPKEDLSWLQNPGEMSEPAPSTPAQSTPSAPSFDTFGQNKSSTSGEDLSWLQNLGEPSEPVSPTSSLSFDTFAQDTPSAGREDMDWLQNLGEESQPVSATPSASTSEPIPPAQDEPDWLKNAMEQSEDMPASPASADVLSPSHTAPLSEETEQFMPDWLKRASEQPSMPMGVDALDQFRDKNRLPAENLFDWLEPSQEPPPTPPMPSRQEEPFLPAGTPVPDSIDSSLFSPVGDTTSISNEDVDSLLSMEMPDWLSRPDPGTSEASPQEAAVSTAERDEALAPVELPSWVQAMRPVESVVSENAASIDDQPTEQDGPLAGLRGLIPMAPIGSAQRPKPISLKLQATDEQQAGAALLQQILASETAPRAVVAESVVLPQNILRWALSALLVVVLGSMIFLRTQSMPVPPALPEAVGAVASVVANIPENSQVLVVIDYEPALAGEMEATSGPLLDQMVLLRRPRLSFVSTSPNGSALAERLMTSTNINQPSPVGLGYNAGEHYFNLGYLPGGAAGALEFVGSPKTAVPSAAVDRLSEFSAVLVLTDHAESGRIWVEQLAALKQVALGLNNQPLLVVSSAQAGPLLQPYVSSGQITGMVSGLSDAVTYEFVNNGRPGIARTYWDTFGVGLMTAIAAIVLGSLWSLFTGLRARRAEAKQG